MAGTHAVTASIGVAGVTEASGDPTEILAAADMALYEAKESGRNRVAAYDAGRLSRHRSRLNWSQRLRGASTTAGSSSTSSRSRTGRRVRVHGVGAGHPGGPDQHLG